MLHEPVEQDDANRQAELLAGGAVDKCLKRAYETRRLEPTEPSGSRVRLFVRSCEAIEGRELIPSPSSF